VSLISEPDGMEVTVTLDGGKVWFEGISSEKLSYTEEPQETDHGDMYMATLRGFFPGDSEELLSYFVEMKQSRYLLKVKDNNGELRLMGTIEEAARFRVTLLKDSEQNGYQYSFVAMHHDLPPFFVS
jgi:hypothetical protein